MVGGLYRKGIRSDATGARRGGYRGSEAQACGENNSQIFIKTGNGLIGSNFSFAASRLYPPLQK